jgi:hypothetical protein
MLETNVGPGEKRQNDIKIRQKKRKERGGGKKEKEKEGKKREKKSEEKRTTRRKSVDTPFTLTNRRHERAKELRRSSWLRYVWFKNGVKKRAGMSRT